MRRCVLALFLSCAGTLSLATQFAFDSADAALWHTLGPFPVGTRELLPPRPPVSHFSPLVDSGWVEWTTVSEDAEGWVSVGDEQAPNPPVRWSVLRAAAGWSILQHQRWYIRRLTISDAEAGLYSFSLSSAAVFSVRSLNHSETVAHSFQGDMHSPPHALPHLLHLERGSHELAVQYVHDIRVSGEPAPDGAPRGKWKLEIHREAEEPLADMVIVPDVVRGLLLGAVIGVEVRNRAPASLRVVGVQSDVQGIALALKQPVTVAAFHTRLVSLSITQDGPLLGHNTSLSLTIFLSSGVKLSLSAPLVFAQFRAPFLSTFLSNTNAATYALYTPPLSSEPCLDTAIVALHGAGVDPATARNFWTSAVPPQRAWIVWPLGLTEWGYDWHGPSLADAKNAVTHLEVVRQLWARVLPEEACKPFSSLKRPKLVIIGHSNGGQGAWHWMSHFPDEQTLQFHIIKSLTSVKIQDYVPYTMTRGAHYRDPLLTGVLNAALSTFDNDLHASNLAGLTIVPRHGENDDNVPVIHSREMVSTVLAWSNGRSQISYSEVRNRGHWFDDVFSDGAVLKTLDRMVDLAANRTPIAPNATLEFTLTCVNPDETGSMNGFRIIETEHPGRLARISVRIWPDESRFLGTVRIRNVLSFSFDSCLFQEAQGIRLSGLIHDGQALDLPISPTATTYSRSINESQFLRSATFHPTRKHGPLISILKSPLPLVVVVGTTGPPSTTRHLRQIAGNIGRDSFVYGHVDSVIVDDCDFVAVRGNVVLLGSAYENLVVKDWSKTWPVEVSFSAPSTFVVHKVVFQRIGQALLFLAPNPNDANGLALVLTGIGSAGLENAARLFPVRTGVLTPEWIVASHEETDGGVLAAGFWANDYSFNEATSYL